MMISGNKNIKLLNQVTEFVYVVGATNFITMTDCKMSMKIDGDGNTINFISSYCDVVIKGDSNKIVVTGQSYVQILIIGKNNKISDHNFKTKIVYQAEPVNQLNQTQINEQREIVADLPVVPRPPPQFYLRQEREQAFFAFGLPRQPEEHEDKPAPQKGLTKKELSLLTISYPSNFSTQCSICMDQILTKQQQTFLPCMHTFHSQCATKWLSTSVVCPICKTNVRNALRQIQGNIFDDQ